MKCWTHEGEGLFFWYIAYSYIHTTKYSRSHDIFVKVIKNIGGGWQLSFKNAGGERVKKVLMY